MMAAPFRMAEHPGRTNVNSNFVFINNYNVHVNQAHQGRTTQGVPMPEAAPPQIEAQGDGVPAQGGAPAPPQHEQQLRPFHANDPKFSKCAYDPQGLDFGYKVVSRLYRAEKLVEHDHNMITYTQCSSTAQVISHALTLYLSYKRSKHAIFLFDGDGLVDQLTSNWPSTIHLFGIESLIQQLGPKYEYHRCKVDCSLV
ncbi:hypothetical protein L7F22_033519 [Adiantum nelumboides]|nr:hypothetical protein [Adiantum nelumboides]